MATIRNLRDLADMVSAEGDTDEELIRSIKRHGYKYTDCGMWVDPTHQGVTIGSIVEGYDGDGTSTFKFSYPFEEQDWDTAVAAIEKEADAIWHWCNVTRYICQNCDWVATDDDDPEYTDDAEDGSPVTICPHCSDHIKGETDAERGIDFPDVWFEHRNLKGFSS